MQANPCVRWLLVAFCIPASAALAQQERRPPAAPSELHFETYCNPISRSEPVAEIQWIATSEQIAQQQLDVTVFHDGFRRGLFVTVQPARAGASFAAPAPPRVVAVDRRRIDTIPGLQNLKVVDIATPDAPSRGNLRSRVQLFRSRPWVVIRVQGLEPGLRYFWRLWPAASDQPSGAFLAPVCPADEGLGRRPGR